MDRIINVNISGSFLTRDNAWAGVQHEGNAKTLRMEFDPGWDGYAKTVTFWNALGQNPVKRILTAELLEDITASTRIYLCPIPPEAMAHAGKLTYVVDGTLEGVRQRSVEDRLRVREAAYASEAGESTDPTPARAEQLQLQVDALRGELQEGIAASQQAVASAGAAAVSEKNAAASQKAAADSEAKAQGYAKQAEGLVTGVTSFNGRTGAVKPRSGDYTADMVGAVALNGSNTMTGALTVRRANAFADFEDTATGAIARVISSGNAALLQSKNADGTIRRQLEVRNKTLIPNIKNALAFVNKDGDSTESYYVLHTGNKPSGSYTGNGDATARTIDTGGIGNVAILGSANSIAIVYNRGAVGINAGDAQWTIFPSSQLQFANGVLKVTTDSPVANTNGRTYEYHVI